MTTTSTSPASSSSSHSSSSADFVKGEYNKWREAFRVQPPLVQRFLEAQGGRLADALLQKSPTAVFTLPDQVIVDGHALPIAKEAREQSAGGVLDRLTSADSKTAIITRLDELEQSDNRALAQAAGLVRYATAIALVRDRLPAGRAVRYRALPGEEIPSEPEATTDARSAITETGDAIAEASANPSMVNGVGVSNQPDAVQVPFVEAARHFYLPQFVAFDSSASPDRLLVKSTAEAQAHVGSMQAFLAVLHSAVRVAPYITADPAYQGKRYGMLGQLVNQARALARHQTRDIIATIKQRSANNDLNRGLSLSLPYFDDNALAMHTLGFVVIPGGRVLFAPAFVVRAVRLEAVKVAQDTRLSPSTRKHLLIQLSLLEKAFDR